jgi:tripartite-type tricarboxylate transporter receptor subunit TctC
MPSYHTLSPTKSGGKNMRKATATLIAIALGSVMMNASSETLAADFYAGKTIIVLNSSDAGGGFDTYTRVLARYLGKYIPGNPSVIVQSIPGGGGLRAAQTLYAVAPKDGTTIGNFRSSNVLDSVLGIRGADLDMGRYNWLGSMGSDTDLCSFWHTAGIRTFDDLRQKEVIVGASGKGAQNYSFPNAMNKILGTKMKIVLGYKGMGDRILALERGELQGNCGMYASSIATLHKPMIENGKLNVVVQSGLTPHPDFPDVPLTQSFASSERDRMLLTALFSQMEIARLFAAPPETPADKVEILRVAFAKALADPELRSETEKLGGVPDLVSGERVNQIVKDMKDLPPKLKAELKDLIDE